MELLKIGLDHPDFRNPAWTAEYTKKDPKEKLSYEQYAFMVWNIIETIFDRGTIDKTWTPVIILEKKLHYKWFEQNRDKFKDKFLNYVDNKTSPPCPGSIYFRVVRRYALAGGVSIAALTFIFIVIGDLILPYNLNPIEYSDNSVASDCARHFPSYNITHPYDCSKFSPGSIAQLCVDNPTAYNVTTKKGCSQFLVPDNNSESSHTILIKKV